METVAKRQRALLVQPPAPPAEAAAEDAADSAAAVFGNVDLLCEILLLLDAPSHLVRAALVSTRWLGAAADPAFLRRFRARCPPRLLGFLATFASSAGWHPQPRAAVARFMPLPHPPEFAGAARLVGATFNGGRPYMESIVGCWNGRVLVKHRGHYDRNYSVLSPLHSSAATGITFTGPLSPPHGRHKLKSSVSCAQLELLQYPGAGDDPYDALWGFGQTTAEPSMFDFDCTTGKFIQQVVYVRRQSTSWVTYVSPPLEVPVQLVFNSEPCSLLVGGRWLCMTTVLGCIVVFDLAAATFSVVSFPDGVSVSCGIGRRTLNHSLARAGDSGIYLVHAMGVELHVWFRRMDGDAAGIWERGVTVDLPVVFGDHAAMEFWDSVRSLNDYVNRFLADYTWGCYSVEIHAIGDNAEFAFLTVGKLGGVFLLDVKKRTVEKVLEASLQDDGQQCGIFAFMMPWPPVFPELNQRG